MKPRFPLSTKIFLLAFCNLVLLGLLKFLLQESLQELK